MKSPNFQSIQHDVIETAIQHDVIETDGTSQMSM